MPDQAARGPRPLPGLDPRFGVAACPFDLSLGPLTVSAQGDVPYWSVSIYDRLGRGVYSFNDRTAIDGRLDIVVTTSPQRARLREEQPEAIDNAVLVRADIARGFALVRALAPDETWTPRVKAFIESARCDTVDVAPPGSEATPERQD